VRLVHGLCLLGALIGSGRRPVAGQAPGDTAPDFTLRTLAGDSVRLADFNGHPVVVNFWGTWCPPCRDEIPMLIEAYEAHRGDSLVILGVNGRDQERSTRVVESFVTELHVNYPVLLDVKGRVRRRYHLRALPTTVFIGTDGTVRAVNFGPLTADELQRRIDEILAAR
jgi:peroxiredoxin